MKKMYLGLTLIGAIVPYLFFFGFFQKSGIDLFAFISALFVNGPASGFTADLLLTSFLFLLTVTGSLVIGFELEENRTGDGLTDKINVNLHVSTNRTQ